MDRVSIDSLIETAAGQAGISPDFYKKVVYKGENSAYPDAIPENLVNKKTGATGIAQVMPQVLKNLIAQGKLPRGAKITDPATNLTAGALVLADGLRINKGSEAGAVAHYNAGTAAGRAVAAGQEAPTAETRAYLQRTGMTTDSNPTDARLANSTASSPVSATIDPVAIMQDFASRVPSYMQGMVAAFQKQAGFDSANADAIEASGKSAASSITIEANSKADNAAYQDKLIKAMGINGLDGSVVRAQQQRSEARAVMDQLRPQIEAEAAIAPWDDPLRWAVNQFTLPKLTGAYNAANRQDRAALQLIDSQQKTQIQQLAIDTLPAADAIRAKGAADAAAKSFDAIAKANAARSAGQQALATSVLQSFAMDDSVAGKWIATARLAQELDGAKTTEEIRKTTAAKNAKQEIELADTMHTINTKFAALGRAPLNGTTFAMLPAAERENLVSWGSIPGSFGSGMSDSFSQIVTVGGLPGLRDNQPQLYNFYSKAFQSAVGRKKQAELDASLEPKIRALPTAAKQALVLDAVEAAWKKEVAGVEPALNVAGISADNPYKLNLNQTVFSETLQTNPFVQTIVERKKLNSLYAATDRDILLEAIAKAKQDPTKISEVARQLSDLYRTGIKEQYAKGGAFLAGLPKPTGGGLTVYGNYVDQSGVTRGLQTWDPVAVEHFLMQNIARNAFAFDSATQSMPVGSDIQGSRAVDQFKQAGYAQVPFNSLTPKE